MSEVATKDKMLTTSLRRGFCKDAMSINRHESIDSPEGMMDSLAKKRADLNNERDSLYEIMGRPNKGNLPKWKGREHKHDHGAALVRYFNCGDQILNICERQKKINTYMSDYGIGGAERHYREFLVDELLKIINDKEQIAMASREAEIRYKARKCFDEKAWIKFVDDELFH